MNSVHHHVGQSQLLDGQRDSSESILDREDSMSTGTKMVNSGSEWRTMKALNSRADTIGLG